MKILTVFGGPAPELSDRLRFDLVECPGYLIVARARLAISVQLVRPHNYLISLQYSGGGIRGSMQRRGIPVSFEYVFLLFFGFISSLSDNLPLNDLANLGSTLTHLISLHNGATHGF